ncbi:hypothetical protein EVAR_11144_1 [Eumeta japonica]|uniref:Uncharacterized protein n=1 Tax=Eumeta variegata TaxID=151549 RepID=A0A4C1U3Z7_EUMVA|nr:hypothetical protein EVAR_11144_1 [Eumeta japonica]
MRGTKTSIIDDRKVDRYRHRLDADRRVATACPSVALVTTTPHHCGGKSNALVALCAAAVIIIIIIIIAAAAVYFRFHTFPPQHSNEQLEYIQKLQNITGYHPIGPRSSFLPASAHTRSRLNVSLAAAHRTEELVSASVRANRAHSQSA